MRFSTLAALLLPLLLTSVLATPTPINNDIDPLMPDDGNDPTVSTAEKDAIEGGYNAEYHEEEVLAEGEDDQA
ncbi:hypothetical protein MMC28_006129 [Mycoblastus sanguinarius]|nr:hypothetical protein [Mycoblastus sanguinarius]